ncbi:MAG: hypothetical protein ACXAEE_09260 [Candidatus Thorarchaeota archaeon]|jgi:hypothetical protein
MLDILLIAVFMGFVFLCAAFSFGRSPQSGRAEITRPTADSVDGFGGARGMDYSYTTPHRAAKPPLPVGLRLERKKTDTHKAYSDREIKEKPD